MRPAYAAVENLPNGADVLVYFAYDPATSGEMDMVSVPVLRHLLEQRSNLTFVSLNPNGPASARRLVRRALAGEMTPLEMSIAVRRITARNFYLSGGAAVSIYSDNEYESYDLDFVPTGLARRVDRTMEALGFARRQRHWVHPENPYWVEFPSGPVAIGEEVIHEFAVKPGGA